MDGGGFEFGEVPVTQDPHLPKLPNKRRLKKGIKEFALEYKDDFVSTPVLNNGIQTDVLVCKFCLVPVSARSDRIKEHLRSKKHMTKKGGTMNIDGVNELDFDFPIMEPLIFRFRTEDGDVGSAWRKAFAAYQITGHFTDVTLAAAEEGKSIKCHKMILSACSKYFYQQLLRNPCEHPIIILKDTPFWELEALVNFFYHGEVFIKENEADAFMKTATQLGVRAVVSIPASYCHKYDDSKDMEGTNGGSQCVVEKGSGTMKRRAKNSSSGSNTCDDTTKMLSESTSGRTGPSGAPKGRWKKMSKNV